MASRQDVRSKGKAVYGSTDLRQTYQAPAQNTLHDHDEMNADLPERFRGLKTRGSNNNPSSSRPETDLELKLNLDIRNYFIKQDAIAPRTTKEKWLSSPEVPTNEELGEELTDVLQNKINGPYKTRSQYLKTQYSLQREDAVGSLRDAIHDFRNNPQTKDTQKFVIYDQVHFAGFTFARKGLAARIRFTTNRAGKKISWTTSKRLTSGTLVALVKASDKLDNFQGLITAVVAARPLAGVLCQEPEIDIYFSRPEDIQIDPQEEWLMIEAKQGYFEAYRHTLKSLKMLSQETFPFSDQICKLVPADEAPEYIREYSSMNLGAAVGPGQKEAYSKVLISEEWPPAPKDTLDDSQWRAYREMITKSLSIIQGPPGTGKTHVSKVAIQTLVENSRLGDPPIIIAAQTNHALDQLLEHVSQFEPSYIRLGGRSTNPEIKKRALFEIRRQERIKQIPGGLMGRSNSALDKKAKEMIGILEPIRADVMHDMDPFSTDQSPATKTLVQLGVLNAQQAKSLEEGASQWVSANPTSEGPISLWLDRALCPFVYQYSQDNYGFDEVEEEDLEFEQLRENEDSSGVNDEEDIEMLKGPFAGINDKFTVQPHTAIDLAKAEKQLDLVNDLWKVPDYLRGPMYSVIRSRAIAAICKKFSTLAKEYSNLVTQSLIGKWEQDAVYLQRARIIGLTTTGLSKYRALISALRPRVCLIEEAAEVLEAPVTVACVESLQHLILVGDHQQLQGHCSVPELEGDPYFLAVSLFERLVRNRMPYKALLRQRRMDPEFRRLISSIYPNLTDHPLVLNRPVQPWGMGTLKSFFFDHPWSEDRDASMSVYNEEEAKFIAGFYRYLQQNGVVAERITILTFYNGQRKKILRELRDLLGVTGTYHNVKTVDSYQGEENDIVLLSMVRSNADGKIGFLANDNRVNVALSRAKFGFYLFGNAKALMTGSGLWMNVVNTMNAVPKRMSDALPIRCKNHGITSLVENADQWEDVDCGGCTLLCDQNLTCGHNCPLKCHPYSHDGVKCDVDCHKLLPCGHSCDRKCTEPCNCDCDLFESIQRKKREEEEGKLNNVWPQEGQSDGTGKSLGRDVRNLQKSVKGQHDPPFKSVSYLRPQFPGLIDSPAFLDAKPIEETNRPSMSARFPSRNIIPRDHKVVGTPALSLHEAEVQHQSQEQWTQFSRGGAQVDDKRRASLEDPVQRLEMPLIDLLPTILDDDAAGGVEAESVQRLHAGRNRYLHDFRVRKKRGGKLSQEMHSFPAVTNTGKNVRCYDAVTESDDLYGPG